MQDCGQHDQGQDPRGDPQDFQHQERFHPQRRRAGPQGERVVWGEMKKKKKQKESFPAQQGDTCPLCFLFFCFLKLWKDKTLSPQFKKKTLHTPPPPMVARKIKKFSSPIASSARKLFSLRLRINCFEWTSTTIGHKTKWIHNRNLRGAIISERTPFTKIAPPTFGDAV